MDCKFNMQDMIPVAALAKLSASEDVGSMDDREFLIKFNDMVCKYELLYHEISEHEGFDWDDD